ncbi:MAG: procyclic acidic repetitive family protein [Muribaculaceae bacterium]|nr:procyclic acidic repetitive family protein [Muribaculaceae bacterium]
MQKINGTPPVQHRPEPESTSSSAPKSTPPPETEPISVSESKPAPVPEPVSEPVSASASIAEPAPLHEATPIHEPAPAPSPAPEHEKALFDEKTLYSESLSEQRYAWHKFLSALLSSIEIEQKNNLKHFTVFIRKIAGVKYQWNDEAFKRELLASLESYDCASYIGASSFHISVVLDKTFRQETERPISDTQFRQVHKDIVLFGSRKETAEQQFATAIDKRAYVINELLKKFRSSTGTDTKLMEDLVIFVVRNEEDDDMAKYDWIGKRFEDDLRRELTNAFLDRIGSKSLQIVLKPKSEIEGCISLIDNQVYYKWGRADVAKDDSNELPYERVTASLSIIEGTGSMMKPVYTLDSDSKKIYHIGRGVASRKAGKYRVNDIVIKDKEADEELLQCNSHVSSSHADIVFKNNRFFLKASIGGCRSIGGSPTKIVRDEKATELRDTNLMYPLEDGDMIELGKNVLLIYTIMN